MTRDTDNNPTSMADRAATLTSEFRQNADRLPSDDLNTLAQSPPDAGFMPMAVNNTSFLLDRLGQDCHPLQQIRELTQNGIEAILRTGSPGQIVWEAEPFGVDSASKPIFKLSVTDTGDPGNLEDRAAKFIPEQNLLQINADFSVFGDMIDHCCMEAADCPRARDVAEKAVRGWCEQALIETVIGAQELWYRKHWSTQEIEKALTPEALTAASMQRYHVVMSSKHEVARKLGANDSPGHRRQHYT